MTNVSQLLESRRSRIGRWTGAAVIVCGLHAGGVALALMQWPEEETADDAAGAITMELAPLPAAVPVDSPDVAHGPLMEEAMQTPETTKKVVEDVQTDIPPVEPSPAPEPEVALPKPQPVEKEEPKPEEEPQEAVPEQQTPVQASAAPLTTAPPRVDVEAPPTSAASPGQGASIARAQATWQKTLVRHLERFKRYPEAARSRRAQGEVIVAFTLDRSGQIVTSRVTHSSGSRALDEEALAVLQRASPLPAPPGELPGPFDLSLPIQFRIR
jgi:protein TonB